jgi:membrane protein YdbS with pleckstrin-like domain
MRCHACGEEVVETAAFCHRCGARTDRQAGEAPPDLPRNDPAPRGEPSAGGPTVPSSGSGERLQGAMAAARKAADEPEKELWEGTYSPKAMIGPGLASGLASLALLMVGIHFNTKVLWYVVVFAILLLWLYQAAVLVFRRMSVRYRLTTRRFFHEKGVIRHVTDRIEVIDMDDISVEQYVLDRIIGVGTIRITSSDRTHPVFLVSGIENVQKVAGMMDEARLGERLRRGLHIESV